MWTYSTLRIKRMCNPIHIECKHKQDKPDPCFWENRLKMLTNSPDSHKIEE